jgi:hypothetical protein
MACPLKPEQVNQKRHPLTGYCTETVNMMSPVGLRSENGYALTMPGKNLKVQTRLLVREGASHQQTRNCLKIIKERMGKIGRGSQIGV